MLIGGLGYPNCHSSLDEYIDMVFLPDENGEKHHILPKSVFPEYENLKEFTWNSSRLTRNRHIEAHKLLFKAWPIRKFQRPINRMRVGKDDDLREAQSVAARNAWKNMSAQSKAKWTEKRIAYLKRVMVSGNLIYDSLQAGARKNFNVPNWKLSHSIRVKDRWASFTTSERMDAARKKMTDTVREAISASVKKRYEDNEFMNEFIETMSRVNACPDKRARTGKRLSELWDDSEYREKVLASRGTDESKDKRFLSNMKKSPKIWSHSIAARELYDAGIACYRAGVILGVSCNAMYKRFRSGFIPSESNVYKQFKEWYEANQS